MAGGNYYFGKRDSSRNILSDFVAEEILTTFSLDFDGGNGRT